MAIHRAPSTDPLRLDAERYATNGQSVSPMVASRIAEGFNHVLARRRKLLLCKAANMASLSDGINGDFWPIYVRTGELGTSVVLHYGFAQAKSTFISLDPSLLVSWYDAATETLIDTATANFNRTGTTSTVKPSDIAHTRVVIEGLTANTEYYIHSTAVFGLRPVYLTATEVPYRFLDDADSPVCNPGQATSEAPLLDADYQRMVTANNTLWRHNGTHLFSWVADYDIADAPATVAGTYTDLLTGTADSRKFAINAQYHTTLTRTTVPVKMAVKATRPSGSGTCDVRLTDGTNTVTVSGIDNSAADGWYTATGTIPAANTATWQIVALDSADPYLISAVYLFPWEA